VCGYLLTKASVLPYALGEEVDISYLVRLGSAKGEDETILGGGG